MNDKELLELAAKAAGWEHTPDFYNQTSGAYWNPLTDDGDALRLAVKLGICCKYERNASPELNIPRECAVAITDDGKWIAESDERDPYAAARRAIVRAAAIGKAMP